jgi:hypothetical protein
MFHPSHPIRRQERLSTGGIFAGSVHGRSRSPGLDPATKSAGSLGLAAPDCIQDFTAQG